MIPGELGAILLGLGPLAEALRLLPEKQLALLRYELLNVVPARLADDLRYELGADTQLGQKVELSQQIYNDGEHKVNNPSCPGNTGFIHPTHILPIPAAA